MMDDIYAVLFAEYKQYNYSIINVLNISPMRD